MFKKYISVLCLALISNKSFAQTYKSTPSDKIYRSLGQLKHLTSVLYVAAHPDDENTRLLAWLVNEKHINTSYLSLTRGDGGQNILGSEQGAALGLIRTHELMAARGIDGAEQYFTRAVDFGFSKNYTETFLHWDKDILVGDAVWVIRNMRPDVIICRFPPDSLAGHGQHAASAIVGAEAFKAAGNGNQYTEQLKAGLQPWSAKRILWNTFKFGTFNTTSEDQFKTTVGQYIPTLGMGTGELAGISRSVHKSQGAGTPSIPGEQTEYFKIVDGEAPVKSLFDGIDITWGRVQRKDIGDDTKALMHDFDFIHPDRSIPALLAIKAKIKTVADPFWRQKKLAEIDKIILDCSGFNAEIFTKQPQAIAGATLPFTLKVIARSETAVILKQINWVSTDTSLAQKLYNDSLYTYEHNITLPAGEQNTQPYWINPSVQRNDLFDIPGGLADLGRPISRNTLQATLSITINNEPFEVQIPLSFKKLDPVKGDVVEQLRIVPPATMAFTNQLLFEQTDGSIMASMRIQANRKFDHETLHIKTPVTTLLSIPNITLEPNVDTLITFKIPAPASTLNLGTHFNIYPELTPYKVASEQHLIQYSHIPTLQYFTAPYATVLKKNWKCTAKRIGYIEGAGDYTATLLRLVGLEVDVLKETDFSDVKKLAKYDAIISGIRCVNVEKKMAGWLPILFQYVQQGGTLLMLYNTTQDLATTKIGPYPFTLSSKRVTEEQAEVVFLAPRSKLLTYPNKITQSDFIGWLQERGLYFASKWDEHYTPIFSMHDANEAPLEGCTLYTPYGKGHYIYTTLSFNRQLPVGNEGAIKLLMNMISIGK